MTTIHKELSDNPHLAKFYAKSNCKKCNGRGQEQLSLPAGHDIFDSNKKAIIEKSRLCQCVIKALKNE